MSATTAARKLAKNATELASMRSIGTRIRAPPAVPFIGIIQDVERHNLASTFRTKPPSGWRKAIVQPSYYSASTATATTNDVETDIAAEEPEVATAAAAVADNNNSTQPNDDDDLPLQVDMEELRALALQRCTALKLADMYKYAVDVGDQKQRLSNAQFLHRELPIRIAQRAVDLLTLPHGLSEAPPIRQVAHYYLQYLVLFQEFPVPTTPDEEEKFTELLQGMVLDRTSIPNAVNQGVSAWVSNELTEGLAIDRLQEMEDALYRFFTARVGLRFLTEHHILSAPKRLQNSSHQQLKAAQSPYNNEVNLGCIQTDCCPAKEVRKVVEEVARQTKEHFGICPEIEVVDSTKNKNANFTYVPHHLHYMVGELIKNSCRATVRRHLETGAPQDELPPIRVVIVKGSEDVTIKVADRGGGIPRSRLPKIWKFAHSTAEDREQQSEFGVDEVTGTKIRGFGLPLSRIYARYFGGELTLKSMEGYGLDAYLHLPRLGDSCENLPLRVSHSPGERVSLPPRKLKLVDPTASRDGNARKFSTMNRQRESILIGGDSDGVAHNNNGESEDEKTTEDITRRILKILHGRAL